MRFLPIIFRPSASTLQASAHIRAPGERHANSGVWQGLDALLRGPSNAGRRPAASCGCPCGKGSPSFMSFMIYFYRTPSPPHLRLHARHSPTGGMSHPYCRSLSGHPSFINNQPCPGLVHPGDGLLLLDDGCLLSCCCCVLVSGNGSCLAP
jgi:hypothetical protein